MMEIIENLISFIVGAAFGMLAAAHYIDWEEEGKDEK